jgi:hypothetical protein
MSQFISDPVNVVAQSCVDTWELMENWFNLCCDSNISDVTNVI